MKTLFSIVALVLAFFADTAQAQTYVDNARVLQVVPVVQQIDCAQTQRSNTGAAIGGLAGALLGSNVGGGDGKLAAVAVGGILGAITGDRVDNQNNANCSRQVISGYQVSFEYMSRVGVKNMRYDPGVGSFMRVYVTVDPQ